MALEKSVYSPFNHLPQLLAWEQIIEFSRREIFQLYTEWHKKGNFWKTQQKLKKSKKKNVLTEIEPLQLAF